MIDKKISLGTLLTLGTIIGTFIYTQGVLATKMDSIESDSADTEKKIQTNINKIQDVEVNNAKIESKIDEGFKRLESLIMEM
tara:strand:- start:3845 stop:4090 length:246 start_codon:yes stop_codon:yes gene_type:complete